MLGHHPFHVAGDKYAAALLDAAGCMPVIIPAIARELELAELLDSLEGLLFMGSPTNIEPHRYQGEPSEPGTLHDAHRDATTLPLLPRAVAAGVPVFGICRGCQEMNVAYGGTLWQKLQEVAGLMDHRDDPEDPLDVQYGPAHDVQLTPGGLLQRLAGGAERIAVNSLHWQGVRELGTGLVVEARAADGVIEAFRDPNARRFALAVQWHPEWQALQNEFSVALFAEFGASCRDRMKHR
jgi:putative glutamine amidotransferase